MMRKAAELVAMLAGIFLVGTARGADAACLLEPQGQEHVSAIIDARTFRLHDGREIRLAGIEPVSGFGASPALLTKLIDGRSIRLHGSDDTPDRYGRQSAFAFVENDKIPVQVELLTRGEALFSGQVNDKPCAADLLAAEATARKLQRGIWASASALKKAERPDDILAVVGQFAIVEGKVLSARQAGATWYVNFSRRWTEGFAVTVSTRSLAALETAGISLRALENKSIRVRGWVEQRGGPRIEIFKPGQIELAGER